jgi:hypothetical protein
LAKVVIFSTGFLNTRLEAVLSDFGHPVGFQAEKIPVAAE